MIGMTFDAPPELKLGDEVEIVTDIRRHDIVCWERVSDHKLIMRALTPQAAATYPGRKFQVDRGDDPGTFNYVEVVVEAGTGADAQWVNDTSMDKADNALRRHEQVYATPGVPAFNSNWVTERIMAGRNPLTVHDIATLAAQGITHILDLREPHEWTAKFGSEALTEIERRGLQRRHVLVGDMQAPTSAAFDAAYQFLEAALQDPNHRVYVHCRAGNERTASILVAYYACQQGVSYEAALAALRARRPTFHPLHGQARAVRQWLKSKAQDSD